MTIKDAWVPYGRQADCSAGKSLSPILRLEKTGRPRLATSAAGSWRVSGKKLDPYHAGHGVCGKEGPSEGYLVGCWELGLPRWQWASTQHLCGRLSFLPGDLAQSPGIQRPNSACSSSQV